MWNTVSQSSKGISSNIKEQLYMCCCSDIDHYYTNMQNAAELTSRCFLPRLSFSPCYLLHDILGLTHLHWRWTLNVPPKCRLIFDGLNDNAYRKVEPLFTTPRISNPPYVKAFLCSVGCNFCWWLRVAETYKGKNFTCVEVLRFTGFQLTYRECIFLQ
jgi:hypothetical protein